MTNNKDPNTTDKRKWVPEIMYEEGEEGLSGNLPFVQVPDGKEMPGVLFLFASQDTGEFEPGLEGEPVPIVDLELHQYCNMAYLKEGLDEYSYNVVRQCLGLDSLSEAAQKGSQITQKIREKVQNDL